MKINNTIPMNNHDNNTWGIICGTVGGLWKYFFDHAPTFLKAGFWPNFYEACLTAFVCGILGAAGQKVLKYAWAWVKTKFKR